MTQKLYWNDVLASTFTTRGARLATLDDKPTLVLAETLFYPEGGGQLGDTGALTIGGTAIAVTDTRIDESGAIHHVLGGAAPSIHDDVTIAGAIDVARRRDHMAQHTAQHALSRALLDHARAPTVSARLGASTCTIDVSRPGLADADLHRVEDVVNDLTRADVSVVASFPTDDELAKLDLRKKPNAEKSARAGVRVVTIEDFDVTPCGGTHVTRTGQIGQVRIVGTEKYKGMLRITFHAGRRALDDARAKGDALAAAAAALTCGALDVPSAIAKLRAELKATKGRLDDARAELATLAAKELLAARVGSGRVVAVSRPNDDLAGVRALAGEITKHAADVVALAATADPASGELVVVVQRGASALAFDCGAFVSARAKAANGRGGGRPERAEGRFPKGVTLEGLGVEAERLVGESRE